MWISRHILLPVIALSLVLSGFAYFPGQAQAQLTNGTGAYVPPTTQTPAATPAAAPASGGVGATIANGAENIFCGLAIGACAAAKVAQNTEAIVSCFSDVGNCLIRAVATAILTFANFLLGIAGALLNFVVYYCVFKFGSLIGNSPGVLTAWGILRDIANITLLFGFIFLGIATILNTDKFPTKRAIPKLLVFAVLMNFSLFAVEAVIDVANGMSTLLYTQADPTSTQCIGPTGTPGVSGDDCSFLNYGIAGHIMESTGLASIWAGQGTANPNISALLGLAVFATIGFIVLLAAAIMLAIRLVVLTFLMVVSPIGFAGMAIPFFQKFAGDWWQRVIHQAFFAPIMFLLIFVSLKISDSFTSGTYQGTNGGLSSGLGTLVTNPNTSTMGIALVFMLVCSFLLASVIVAHRFSATGAQGAIGFGKKIILGGYGMAGRAAGGYVGRSTVGRASNWAQKKYNAKVATGGLKFLQGSSIDDAILGTFKRGEEAKFGSNKSFKSDKEHHKARADELSKIRRFETAKNIDPDAVTALTEMTNALKNLTSKQLVELVNQLKDNEQQLGLIATALSSERLEKIYDSDEVNDGAKERMLEHHFAPLKDALDNLARVTGDATSTDDERAEAQKEVDTRANSLNIKDIGLLARSRDSQLLENQDLVGALSDDQFKEARKSNHLSEEQGRRFQATRDEMLVNTDYVIRKIGGMNEEAINKLKSAALANEAVLDTMTGRKIALIDTSKIGDDAHKDVIVNYVISEVMTDPTRKASFLASARSNIAIQKRWESEGIVM